MRRLSLVPFLLLLSCVTAAIDRSAWPAIDLVWPRIEPEARLGADQAGLASIGSFAVALGARDAEGLNRAWPGVRRCAIAGVELRRAVGELGDVGQRKFLERIEAVGELVATLRGAQ